MITPLALALGALFQDAGLKSFGELLPPETDYLLTFRDPPGLVEERRSRIGEPSGETYLEAYLRVHEDFDLREAVPHVHGEFSIAWLTPPRDAGFEYSPAGDVLYFLPGPGVAEFGQIYEDRIRGAEDCGVEVQLRAIAGVEVTVLAGSVYTFPLGDVFVVTFSEEHAGDVIARARGDNPSSLAHVPAFRSVRQALDLPGPSFSMYQATGRIWNRVVEMADRRLSGPEDGNHEGAQTVRIKHAVWRVLGLAEIEAMGMAAAFGPDRAEIRAVSYSPRGAEGVFRSLPGTMDRLAWPEFRTDDWDLACSFRLDAIGTVDVLTHAVMALAEARGGYASPEEILAPDLRQGVIENLTGVFTILGRSRADAGGREGEPDAALLSAIRNPEEVAEILDSNMQGRRAGSEMRTYREEEYLNAKLHILGDEASERAIAVYGGYFIQGTPQAVRLAIQRIGHPGAGLQNHDDFQGLSGELPPTSRAAVYFTPEGFSLLWALLEDDAEVSRYTGGGWLGTLAFNLLEWLRESPAGWFAEWLPTRDILAPGLTGGLAYAVPRDDGALLRIVLRYEQD